MELNVRFPVKTTTVAIAAALLAPLVADWATPGAGCRAAFDALRETCGGETPPPHGLGFSLWGWIVRLVGWNVEGLGVVSFAGALVCVGLVGQIVGDIFAIVLNRARDYGIELEGTKEFAGLRNAAIIIGTLAFVLTPAFLRAATRTGPLMVWMARPLAVAALVIWFLSNDFPEPIRALRRLWLLVLAAALLLVHSVREAYFFRHAIFESWRGFAVFAAVGIAPCLVLAGLVRFRLLFIVYRRVQLVAFGAWALAVVVTGVIACRSVGQGRAASRLVGEVIANAEGKQAIVCTVEMEPLFAFALGGMERHPRLISLAHEHDPVYGRRLAEWVRQVVMVKGEGDGLAFAAELGAFALIDEWAKVDPTNFEAQVVSFANYFPTAEKWRAACAVLTEAADDPFGDALRRFLGAAGNALGCRLLEKGEGEVEGEQKREAWEVFREITEKVDRENYTALLNRMGMLQRGYKVPQDEATDLSIRFNGLTRRLGTRERVLMAVAAGGRLYVDPETVALQEKERVARLRNRKLTPREEALVAAATKPPESTAECQIARSTLTAAVKDGMVRVDHVGHQLINLDFAIGDWALAEHDAISILRVDHRHHPTANAAMGTINGVRGDYERAEKYFRRARSAERRSDGVLNDLTFTLARTGRAQEAVPLAQEAVAGLPGNWNFRETLAYALIRAGEAERGEAELAKAEAGALAAGRKKDEIVRFAIDRAWLSKMKGDKVRRNIAVRTLRLRTDLTDSHRRELEEIAAR